MSTLTLSEDPNATNGDVQQDQQGAPHQTGHQSTNMCLSAQEPPHAMQMRHLDRGHILKAMDQPPCSPTTSPSSTPIGTAATQSDHHLQAPERTVTGRTTPRAASVPASRPSPLALASRSTVQQIITASKWIPLTIPPPPSPSLEFVDHLMTPPPPSAGLTTEHRRRGRQATACLECNRRKQKCDRLQPCFHCAKRNLSEGCIYPDTKACDGLISPSVPQTPVTPVSHSHKRKGGTESGGNTFFPKRERRSDEIGGIPASLHASPETPTHAMRLNSSASDNSPMAHSLRSHHRSNPSFYSSASGGSSSALSSELSSYSPSGSLNHPLTHIPTAPFPIPLPMSARPFSRSIPVSSERHEVVTPPPQPPQWLHQYRSLSPDRSREWRQEMGHGSAAADSVQIYARSQQMQQVHVHNSNLGPNDQPGVPPTTRETRIWASNGNGHRTPKTGAHLRLSVPRSEDHLMQEGGAPGIGSLAKEGADEHGHQFQFYGTSHFGPRLAAQVMHGGNATVNVSDSQYRSSSGEEDLLFHIHQLDSALPKRSLCGRFVYAFFHKYNFWVNVLYEDDFQTRLHDFWVKHSEFEDLTSIDLRWFALFHTVLAFGSLLDDTDTNLNLPERQAISDKCFIAARRALSEAPSFYGESMDTVSAYALLSFYLVAMRRMPEAWHMVGSGVRAAQAQGFHVDGETWHLDPKTAELWRRLWAQLYILERSISYFLGRPLIIQDSSFTTHAPANMHDTELEVLPRSDWPLATSTRSTFLVLHYKLAQIIGQILNTCFGLRPRTHEHVMRCEELMNKFQAALPPVFRFDDPDMSLDEEQPWLRLQRRTLMSKFHQARISLHRPYLLPSGRSDYTQSRVACVTSAGVELRHRLSLLATDHDPFDRFKWLTVASGFAPACVLGLLLARAQRETQYNYKAIRDLLIEYMTVEKHTLRRDRTLENELAVLDMMLAQANEVDAQAAERSLRASKAPSRVPTPGTAKMPDGGGDRDGSGGDIASGGGAGKASSKRSLLDMVSPSAQALLLLGEAPAYPLSTPAPLLPTTATAGGVDNIANTSHKPSASAATQQLQQVHGAGFPPATMSAPPLSHEPQPQPASAFPQPQPQSPVDSSFSAATLPLGLNYTPTTSASAPARQSSFLTSAGALETLAPTLHYAAAPGAGVSTAATADSGSEDARLFTFPSPMDPSADTFPPVHDMNAWAGLLESIGPDWTDEV